jgi:hypothetical protein
MFAWLFQRAKPERSHGDFPAAYERYQSACRRGDTRAQHEAWPALRDAMTARLRARA